MSRTLRQSHFAKNPAGLANERGLCVSGASSVDRIYNRLEKWSVGGMGIGPETVGPLGRRQIYGEVFIETTKIIDV